MSNEEAKQPWEQQEGESAKWFSRFDQFRLMKPWKRSVNAVFEEEGKEKEGKGSTKINGRWYQAAKKWQWDERATAYDEWRRGQRDQQIAEKEADILDIEYAQKYERVKSLDENARLLEQSWHGPEGTENEGKIVFQWLTPDKIKEWRGCLDDIARELGDRVKKQELTGKDGGPLDFKTEWGGGGIEEDDETEG